MKPTAKPEQPPFLLIGRHQPLRQPGAEDSVLFPEVGNLTGQILTGDGSQQGEERMQNAARCDTVLQELLLPELAKGSGIFAPLGC